jgi:hypothetical protein
VNVDIRFAESAFEHKIEEADIRHALNTFIYEEPMENFENKILVIGFDRVGNLLEIAYNVVNDGLIKVFHAMKCRNEYIKLIH